MKTRQKSHKHMMIGYKGKSTYIYTHTYTHTYISADFYDNLNSKFQNFILTIQKLS